MTLTAQYLYEVARPDDRLARATILSRHSNVALVRCESCKPHDLPEAGPLPYVAVRSSTLSAASQILFRTPKIADNDSLGLPKSESGRPPRHVSFFSFASCRIGQPPFAALAAIIGRVLFMLGRRVPIQCCLLPKRLTSAGFSRNRTDICRNALVACDRKQILSCTRCKASDPWVRFRFRASFCLTPLPRPRRYHSCTP